MILLRVREARRVTLTPPERYALDEVISYHGFEIDVAAQHGSIDCSRVDDELGFTTHAAATTWLPPARRCHASTYCTNEGRSLTIRRQLPDAASAASSRSHRWLPSKGDLLLIYHHSPCFSTPARPHAAAFIDEGRYRMQAFFFPDVFLPFALSGVVAKTGSSSARSFSSRRFSLLD